MSMMSPGKSKAVSPGFGTEEQFLQIRSGHFL